MTYSRERVALAAFVAGALLAGGNGVSIRFSNRELPSLWARRPPRGPLAGPLQEARDESCYECYEWRPAPRDVTLLRQVGCHR